MTTKHTPGPWRVDVDGVIRADNGDEVFASHGDTEGHYLAATPEDRRLIAAAPDLLAACERLLDAVERRDHKAKAVDAARAAIARAKGGAA